MFHCRCDKETVLKFYEEKKINFSKQFKLNKFDFYAKVQNQNLVFRPHHDNISLHMLRQHPNITNITIFMP